MNSFVILCVLIISPVIYSAQVRAEKKPALSEGKNIYLHYCAPCHGMKGDGKGFNAENLDPRPAKHTDAKLMSRRTDKDLYDVIKGGGKAVGKSTLMPPWGDTLGNNRIKSLVLYLRKLCKCQGL